MNGLRKRLKGQPRARARESLRAGCAFTTIRTRRAPPGYMKDDASPHPPERRQRNEFINEHCFSDELGAYTLKRNPQAGKQAGRQTPGKHLQAPQAQILGQGAGNVGSPLAGHAFGFQRTPSAGR